MTIFNREDSRTVLPQLEKSIKGVNQRIDGLLDFFYPVGCYFETSDVDFDPNKAWGGEWELETAGQVHISAGTGYSINGALTNTTDGGSKDAVAISHTHNFNMYVDQSGYGTTIPYGQNYLVLSTGVKWAGSAMSDRNNTSNKATENAGVSGTDKNMQPYIIVNRWHRTK